MSTSKDKHRSISHIFSVAFSKLNYFLNNICFYIFTILPLINEQIVFESEGDFCDNAYALYDYMKKNNYFKKRQPIWLVDNLQKFQNLEDTIFLSKNRWALNIKLMYYLARSKYIIFDHNNPVLNLKKRKGQEIIYLSHGFGYKAKKGPRNGKNPLGFDKIVATGKFPADGNCKYWDVDVSNAIITGYPRTDYFFDESNLVKEKVDSIFSFSKYKNTIIWMPTFRKSTNQSLSEDYIKNETGLPLFSTKNSLSNFDVFLGSVNTQVLLKIHHLQADLPIFKAKFSNILIVSDEELEKFGIQLYQLISLTDALVTDYSSISIDYMLLDRPIIYTLDDYEEYKQSRGLWPNDCIDYMKGYHVYTEDDMKESILDITRGIDKYRKERNEIINIFHEFQDGNSSRRLVDYLEL